jgi:hypothetical protein
VVADAAAASVFPTSQPANKTILYTISPPPLIFVQHDSLFVYSPSSPLTTQPISVSNVPPPSKLKKIPTIILSPPPNETFCTYHPHHSKEKKKSDIKNKKIKVALPHLIKRLNLPDPLSGG